MSCTLGYMVNFISMQLNDTFNKLGVPVEGGEVSNIRWSRPLIKQYIANAIIAVSVSRPEYFTETTEITLVPGCVQNACEAGCTAFAGYIKIVGSNGCVDPYEEKDVSKKFRKVLKRFSDMECLLTSDEEEEYYTPGDIKVDTANPCLFYVTNPVPEGEDIKALVNCVNYPDPMEISHGDDDFVLPESVCGKLRPAVYEYIMHQAFELDIEIDKKIAIERQKQHMDNFLLFLKLDSEVWKRTQKNLKDRFICQDDCAEGEE